MTMPRVNGAFGVVAEPTLRFTNDGKPILNLRLKANKRVRDGKGGWDDGPVPLFIDCTVFGTLAANLAESVKIGDNVVVDGTLEQQEWTDRESGAKRSKLNIIADEVGVSARWSSVTANPTNRSGAAPGPATDDPWASTPAVEGPPF